jgi:RNA-binding protein PNO1
VSALAGAAAEVALKPSFPPIAAGGPQVASETRTVRCPAHRYTPLKESWDAIVKPIVEHMKLMIRMNTKTRSVELKTSPFTTDVGALQKGEDFVRAFMLGFDLADSVALLRLDDLYIGE